MASETRLLEDDARVVLPRPAQEVHAGADAGPVRRAHRRLVDHVVRVAVCAVLGGPPVRGDVADACGQQLDVHAVEPGLGLLAEDEVTRVRHC